jgi:sialic acid synthase SpsE|tara:strand:- start:2634 stop:3680 length:1047 start_codon:yes stop_codon:yes gene_type:complete
MKFNYNNILKKNIPYIIAEIGVNHECSIKKAKKLILLAKEGGADAAKFQTYKASKLAMIKSKAYWNTKKEKTKSQYELFSKFDKLNYKDYINLAKYCKSIKIDFLSTPFDLDAVKVLSPLVPAFKIASSDITNYPLIKKISDTKKPVIVSTGASTLEEIKHTIKILSKKTKKIIIMHCILNYPTNDKDANLKMISSLKRNFKNYVIGYSDHTLPDKNMLNISTAFILGAKVIEKHFTLDKKQKGNDHYHAMDVNDLRTLTNNLKRTVQILGCRDKKEVLESEKKSRKFARRCIVIKNDVKKNSILKEKDIIALRPNIGISAIHWRSVIGKRVKRNLKANTVLKIKDIS